MNVNRSELLYAVWECVLGGVVSTFFLLPVCLSFTHTAESPVSHAEIRSIGYGDAAMPIFILEISLLSTCSVTHCHKSLVLCDAKCSFSSFSSQPLAFFLLLRSPLSRFVGVILRTGKSNPDNQAKIFLRFASPSFFKQIITIAKREQRNYQRFIRIRTIAKPHEYTHSLPSKWRWSEDRREQKRERSSYTRPKSVFNSSL